jgi:hypothetical protein
MKLMIMSFQSNSYNSVLSDPSSSVSGGDALPFFLYILLMIGLTISSIDFFLDFISSTDASGLLSMINDAEKFSEEDKAVKEKVEAKNDLEGLTYNLKNQIDDKEKLGGKLSDEEKSTIENAVDEKIKWLDNNPDASVEEMKSQKKSLEEVVNPIISKIYQNNRSASPPETEDDGSERTEL